MLRLGVLFISKTIPYSFCACVRITPKIVSFVIRKMKDEIGVFQFVFRCFSPPPPPPPPPPRPKTKMPFKYVVNVFSDMSLSKKHLGSRWGKTSKNKLKDTVFIFPMTNVTMLGEFRTHAQNE